MKLSLVSLVFFIFIGSLYSQQPESIIYTLDKKLGEQKISISSILSDTAYMSLHSKTAFREVIKKHATTGKIIMVTSSEPGKKITVKGEIKKQDGTPVGDALVYVYQTSDKGWYSDTAAHVLQNEGDMRHARLFGYFKSSNDGKFEFETIQPKGYPNSDLPAHIHIAVWKNENIMNGIPGELLFDDDTRLTPERRRRSIEEGFQVQKNTGTLQNPLYHYSLIVKE